MFFHSKEQIALALQKKRECNARAQRIVEEFLDPVPTEKIDTFLSSVSQQKNFDFRWWNLQNAMTTKLFNFDSHPHLLIFIAILFSRQLIHINRSHYDDIVEERSIVRLCGYPLCDHTLTDVPKQQYVVSRTKNKVYDITERKKFCSNKCYKSSIYLQEQILTTPLWVRKEDDVLPEFKLLSLDEKKTEKAENCAKTDNKPQNEEENQHKIEKDEEKSTETKDSWDFISKKEKKSKQIELFYLFIIPLNEFNCTVLWTILFLIIFT